MATQNPTLVGELGRIARAICELHAPSLTLNLLNATQGPLWPPSACVDRDGNFVVVGLIVDENRSLVPSQAALVSKDTIPPLQNGKEDFDDLYAAPFEILRSLDLSPGSKDLDIELYTVSYGPRRGDFGGGPRIPKVGDTKYNLNYLPPLNPHLFPLEPLDTTYTRPSVPLHQAPIWGLENDQLVYGLEAGVAIDPSSQGSLGVPAFRVRRRKPITLGEWLRARGTLKITLTRYDETIDAYTGARFDFDFANLLPHSIYLIFVMRRSFFYPISDPRFRMGEPLGIPEFFVTNGKGEARVSYAVHHPFPDDNDPQAGLRILGIGVSYTSDYQNWGGRLGLLGFGVSTHIVFNTFIDKTLDFTPFTTKEPVNGTT